MPCSVIGLSLLFTLTIAAIGCDPAGVGSPCTYEDAGSIVAPNGYCPRHACLAERDAAYCTCHCGGSGDPATFCACPSGFVCISTTDISGVQSYCARE